MAFIKLVVFGFIGLTVIYWSVSLYARSVTKERLEDSFDAAHPDGTKAERETYVQDGLKDYDGSIRPKLIGLVYVVPTIVVAVIIYTINAG